jgi:phenylpropionate dioxygenase-like ring-hydroxylating dioxygenase large terminal subunit
MSNIAPLPHRDSPKLAAIREELRRVAALPFQEAKTLPPEAYEDPALAELERTRIFREDWMCVGRADQIPDTGDYLTGKIDNQPIVAIRQKSGAIRAFSNVCLHRLATLLHGIGRLGGPLTCPYHAWSYSAEGRLIATPHAPVQKSPECQSGAMRLQEFPVEEWGGFLFVSLSQTPQPLAPRLPGLMKLLPGVALERYRNTTSHDEVWNVNWKMLTENFIESYHIFMVHQGSLEPLTPTRNCVMLEGGDGYAIHYCPMIEEAGREIAHPLKPDVPQDSQRVAFDFVVYPAFMVAGTHNFLWWMSLQPLGPSQVAVRWGTGVTPEVIADPAYANYGAELDAFVALANSEDKAILARVREGAAGPLSRPGRLTPFDRPIWEFVRYLDRTLNGPSAPGNIAPLEKSAAAR